MENMIPLNGRIAIVDDQIEQALPLMRVFAKNNIPYVYYKGTDPEYLPEQAENDIRILLLDLNLLGGRDNLPKDIRSSLFSVISHIISPNNYPYVLVLWSRQEKEYKEMLEELFSNALKDRAPITILEWIKSDFFPNFSDEEVNKDEEYKIIDELKKVIAGLPAYSYLMQWENCVHNAADETIQDIFHDFHSKDKWDNNANCVLDMFAKSYLGKYYNDASIEDRAKASLMFLNDVYCDTLESNVIACNFPEENDLPYSVNGEYKDEMAAKINGCLLLSNLFDSSCQPGCVLPIDLKEENTKYFHELFHDCFITGGLSNKDAKQLKKDIYKSLLPFEVVVTPDCDYAQMKAKYFRLVQGVIINADFKNYVNSQSDAFYVSPIFEYEGQKRVLVLNYRYLVTYVEGHQYPNPLFRVRDSVLAEMRSKLARHISRHGIMNL
ncbi:MAG: hypothetical protein J6Y78_08700 [Paludibacteraceae bacterium]|nr:hypothetical protein [Paludibacteraceae bacterium]